MGREKPDEVVVLGGHIDSWDVGQGAMDDGGGAVAAWEAVRLMQRLGLRPRRTVRVVLWTNEENGGRGGLAYATRTPTELAKHVLAMESDNGVFNPKGYVLAASDSAAAVVQQVAALLQPINATGVQRVGESPAADITPLAEAGVPGDGARRGRHRATSGTTTATATRWTSSTRREMARCVAAMAVMAYVVADLPEGLARSATTN